MTAAILGFALPARSQRRRREPGLGRCLRPRRCPRRRARPVRGRRGCVARAGRRDPAARDLPRQPLPGSARPLRGARADRRTLARDGRRPAGRRRCSSSTRTTRWSRISPGRAPARRRSAWTIRRSAARRSSTRPTRSTACAAGLRTSMRPRTSVISATTDARRVATRARRSTSLRVRSSRDGIDGDLVRPLPAGRHARGSACGCRASTTSTTRSRPRSSRGRSGSRPPRLPTGSVARSPAFGRFERVAIDGKTLIVLLVKNPAGANETLRTLLQGDGPSVAVLALNDGIADGRDVSWIWDVDFEPLAARLERLVVIRRARRGARPSLLVRRAGRGADRDRARSWTRRSTEGSS